MSNTLESITGKILRLRTGRSFAVQTEGQRVQALNVASTLRRSGVIGFHVRTVAKPGGGFRVEATAEALHGNSKKQKHGKTQTKKGNKTS